MPSELQRVAQGLVEALDQAPQVVAHLQRTADRCRQNAAIVMQLAGQRGAMAAQQLDAAARACEQAAYYLSMAPPKARGWAEGLVGMQPDAGARPRADSSERNPLPTGDSRPAAERRRDGDQAEPRADKPRDGGAAGDDNSPEGQAAPGRRISDEEGHRLQRKLPRREDVPVTSPKTRGIWVDENGNEEELASGEHDEFEEVREFLRSKRLLPPVGNVTTPSHVETKFAMRMRLRGLRHETIMVNKLPCTGKWSCERFLRYILPPGATLTVFGPDGFKRTYPLPKTRSDDEQG